MSKTREIGKAIKTMLSINFHPYFLGLTIMPKKVTWEYALQFRNDDKCRWHPRIISYYPAEGMVSIHSGYHDESATYVKAETIMILACDRMQAPAPKGT